MAATPLRVERGDDGVVVLTLALPERRNAMTGELTQAWVDAVAFGLIFLVLLARPAGVFGRKEVRRA